MPAKARVGNWQEELVYEADMKAQFENQKKSGGLLSQQILAKAKHHTTPYAIAPMPQDGLLHFYQPIMLQNAETESYLSVDMDDKSQAGTQWKIACTTAPAKKPIIRNCWILIPAPSVDDEFWASKGEGEVVHYGQKFLLQSIPELSEKPVYLSSEKISPVSLSKISKKQEVFFSVAGRQDALWSCVYGHSEFRFEMEGQPVKANNVLLLNHQLTNVPLASSKLKYGNDFGMEFEVCCHKFQSTHAKHGNAPELPSNLWAFVTGPAAAPKEEEMTQEAQ